MPPVRSKKRDDFYRDRRRRKVCAFCADKTVQIDYKEVNRLRRYLSERAKIEPRRKTGTCAGHQRELAVALKRARHVALLPVRAAAPPTVIGVAGRPIGRRRRRRPGAAEVLVGLLMVGGGAAAGLFGSLLGLGGGVLLVPLLTLGFGLPLREAVGVSLVAVIMTSSAAAGVYLERHVANLRLGMSLELFTATGALVGGSIAFLLDERVLEALFAVLLVYVAISMLRSGRGTSDEEPPADDDEPAATPDVADASPRERCAGVGLHVRRLGAWARSEPVVSALLGIGGGIIKVPLMHLGMGVPLRVATATSNLMIGITAAASAVIYLIHGGIDPYVAGPTAIGVFIGANARLAGRASHRPPLPAGRCSWSCSSTRRPRCS